MLSANTKESADVSGTPRTRVRIQDKLVVVAAAAATTATATAAATTPNEATTTTTLLDSVMLITNIPTMPSPVVKPALAMQSSWQARPTTASRETDRPPDGRERGGWPKCKFASRMGRE